MCMYVPPSPCDPKPDISSKVSQMLWHSVPSCATWEWCEALNSVYYLGNDGSSGSPLAPMFVLSFPRTRRNTVVGEHLEMVVEGNTMCHMMPSSIHECGAPLRAKRKRQPGGESGGSGLIVQERNGIGPFLNRLKWSIPRFFLVMLQQLNSPCCCCCNKRMNRFPILTKVQQLRLLGGRSNRRLSNSGGGM